jgi:Flp pilus assembly protein TadG
LTVQGRTFRNYLREERGASGAEFAIVVTVTISLILTSLGMSMLLWTSSSLHSAVERAARCYAIGAAHASTTTCTDPTTTISYATTNYTGPNFSPVFTADTTGCGHTVTGSVTFPLNTGLFNVSFPLAAAFCYP